MKYLALFAVTAGLVVAATPAKAIFAITPTTYDWVSDNANSGFSGSITFDFPSGDFSLAPVSLMALPLDGNLLPVLNFDIRTPDGEFTPATDTSDVLFGAQWNGSGIQSLDLSMMNSNASANAFSQEIESTAGTFVPSDVHLANGNWVLVPVPDTNNSIFLLATALVALGSTQAVRRQSLAK
jgi:hypothetical protein